MYIINTLMNILTEVMDMKDKYLKPFIEVVLMDEEDVIRTSENNGDIIQTSEDELPPMPF